MGAVSDLPQSRSGIRQLDLSERGNSGVCRIRIIDAAAGAGYPANRTDIG